MARKNPRQNSVRIIAGKWRGRKIVFPDVKGLRPTPDRVRETLFNWLQPVIPGAVCIDCFAGSGALGFEAASRGAANVTLIETNAEAIQCLQQNAAMLQAENVQIVAEPAEKYLQQDHARADVIFLDPPFAGDLLLPALQVIDERNRLQKGGVVYLEYPAGNAPQLPQGWRWRRQKKAGDVGYGLAENPGA